MSRVTFCPYCAAPEPCPLNHDAPKENRMSTDHPHPMPPEYRDVTPAQALDAVIDDGTVGTVSAVYMQHEWSDEDLTEISKRCVAEGGFAAFRHALRAAWVDGARWLAKVRALPFMLDLAKYGELAPEGGVLGALVSIDASLKRLADMHAPRGVGVGVDLGVDGGTVELTAAPDFGRTVSDMDTLREVLGRVDITSVAAMLSEVHGCDVAINCEATPEEGADTPEEKSE